MKMMAMVMVESFAIELEFVVVRITNLVLERGRNGMGRGGRACLVRWQSSSHIRYTYRYWYYYEHATMVSEWKKKKFSRDFQLLCTPARSKRINILLLLTTPHPSSCTLPLTSTRIDIKYLFVAAYIHYIALSTKYIHNNPNYRFTISFHGSQPFHHPRCFQRVQEIISVWSSGGFYIVEDSIFIESEHHPRYHSNAWLYGYFILVERQATLEGWPIRFQLDFMAVTIALHF